jgi:hypothetical protein
MFPLTGIYILVLLVPVNADEEVRMCAVATIELDVITFFLQVAVSKQPVRWVSELRSA